jgi:hypothetical protein
MLSFPTKLQLDRISHHEVYFVELNELERLHRPHDAIRVAVIIIGRVFERSAEDARGDRSFRRAHTPGRGKKG